MQVPHRYPSNNCLCHGCPHILASEVVCFGDTVPTQTASVAQFLSESLVKVKVSLICHFLVLVQEIVHVLDIQKNKNYVSHCPVTDTNNSNVQVHNNTNPNL